MIMIKPSKFNNQIQIEIYKEKKGGEQEEKSIAKSIITKDRF